MNPSDIRLPNRPSGGASSVSEFKILGVAGEGGFSTVFEAKDARGEPVALKVIELSDLEPSNAKNIENEVALQLGVVHPNVVRLFDFFFERSALVLVLEYCSGGNLFQQINGSTRLAPQRAKEIFLDVCQGIAAIHERGILLRDIKPENVLLDGAGRAKLCDFGWACEAKDASFRAARAGTAAYMAPEALAGRPQGPEADVWGLGVLLYELSFNREPFIGDSPKEVARAQRLGRPEFEPDCDPNMRELVLRCLEPNEKLRPSIAEILETPFFRDPSKAKASLSTARYTGKASLDSLQTLNIFSQKNSVPAARNSIDPPGFLQLRRPSKPLAAPAISSSPPPPNSKNLSIDPLKQNFKPRHFSIQPTQQTPGDPKPPSSLFYTPIPASSQGSPSRRLRINASDDLQTSLCKVLRHQSPQPESSTQAPRPLPNFLSLSTTQSPAFPIPKVDLFSSTQPLASKTQPEFFSSAQPQIPSKPLDFLSKSQVSAPIRSQLEFLPGPQADPKPPLHLSAFFSPQMKKTVVTEWQRGNERKQSPSRKIDLERDTQGILDSTKHLLRFKVPQNESAQPLTRFFVPVEKNKDFGITNPKGVETQDALHPSSFFESRRSLQSDPSSPLPEHFAFKTQTVNPRDEKKPLRTIPLSFYTSPKALPPKQGLPLFSIVNTLLERATPRNQSKLEGSKPPPRSKNPTKFCI